MNSKKRRALALILLLGSAMCLIAHGARADPFSSGACDPGDPLCVPQSLPDSAVVHRFTRKISGRNASQLLELRRLARAVDGFAEADACDAIVATKPGAGLCTGSAKGPFGNVRVRMPVSVSLTESASGSIRLVITNPSAMEIKPLLSWSPVVDPEHAKLEIDLIPHESGWVVYSRVSVDMRAHPSAAGTIAAAFEKLDAWLVKHLSAV